MVSVVPVTYKDCFAVVVVVVDIVVDITIPMIPKWIEPCIALMIWKGMVINHGWFVNCPSSTPSKILLSK